MPYSRENYALKQGEKRHVARFGRPPAYIRAAALIYWSARPDMYDRSVESNFISYQPSQHNVCERGRRPSPALQDPPLPSLFREGVSKAEVKGGNKKRDLPKWTSPLSYALTIV